MIERKVDRLVFNVENNLLTTGMSSDEIFKIIPGVKIDELGTISINGISGAAVMLNDHLLNLKGTELVSFLQGLHSQDISSIEIIAHPSASFDAEGAGGIIKIITKKKRSKGIELGVGSTYKQGVYAKFLEDASVSFKNEKWVVYVSLNNNNSKNFYEGINTRTIENNPYSFFRYNNATSKGNGFGWRGGFEFDIAKNQTIQFETISNSGNRNTLNSLVNTQVFLNNILDTTVKCLSPYNGKSKNSTYSFNYNWTIDALGSTFKVLSDYSVSNSLSNDTSLNSYYDKNNIFVYQLNRYGNVGDSLHIFTVQSGLNYKFRDKKSNIQFGVKYSNANNFNGNDYFLYNFSNSEWQSDTTQTNHFRYRENILAGYLNFNSKIKRLEYEAGLRIENTQSKSISTTTNTQVADNYTQFFPDVFLKYSLNDSIGRYISLSYSKRISRPPYIILNPFKYFYDQYTIKQGNPFLQPTIEYSLAADYAINNKLSFSLNYYFSKNALSDVYLSQGNYTIETFANLSSADGYYLETTYTNDITKWWNSMVDVAFVISRFRAPDFEQHYTGINFSTTNAIKFNARLSLQSDLNFSSKGYDRFSTSNYNSAVLNIAFQYKLLKDKLLCRIGMNDIFYREGNMSLTENYQGQITNTLFKRDTRGFFIGIRYNFKKGLKKENKQIEKSNNDEMQRTSN
ncbi:outer membrane beta-barrel family protein [Hydrotalea sp. AMD]|uniref:outer membrane beta-barrel family protein n=1 Tax=Hydrotalea sp. AMD TaxID=2501297 RepID=UPI00257C5A75|nr:outer membrane beta-barrel family protein [Hydrotalea sp. AMD]